MRKTSIYLALIAMLLGFVACEDYLDVKPKSQVEADELFSDEGGYEDALWGAYGLMTKTSLYGRELTFGTVDVLAQTYYSTCSGSSTYDEMRMYNYENASVESTFNSIWSGMYNVIANVNNMIRHIVVDDTTKFSANRYNVYLGEAYALRAYLHFDLLRLYAPAYSVNPEAMAIPYITQYTYNPTPSSTVKVVLDSVVSDLTKAANLLSVSDPIVTGEEITNAEDLFMLNRHFHMNYYAVKATLARVYMYMGMTTEASTCAKEVIESGLFTWTTQDKVAHQDEVEQDRIFSPEHIFALQIENLEDYYQNYLNDTKIAGLSLLISDSYLDNRFPPATHEFDYRRVYSYSTYAQTSTSERYCKKLWQVENGNEDYAKRMPLIRLPEMILIAAEADIFDTTIYLNELRAARGITTTVDYMTDEELMAEIRAEYIREFTCEGQLFYYYKRNNSTTMDGLVGEFNTELYVLPLPEEEIEFGNR
ncbi:MAG: RagB/SusD family nutrient uptake outer membrane protein [Odoribacter sp.]|nr:RagB/SusD family nutrient uptake outer membrane protein [Odoribacter sp.]